MAGAGRIVAAREIRARMRALVALGLLAGFAAGIALTATAGARRTASAYERYRQHTLAPDAIVFATQVGVFDADYTAVRELPGVVDAGAFTLAAVRLREHPEVGSLPPGDDRLFRTVARPLLRHGRVPDPTRDDEIVLSETAARELGLTVGDTVTLESATSLEAFFLGTGFDGPAVRATIVGVGDSPMDLIFSREEPVFVPSAGFLAAHGHVVPHAANLIVRLQPGTDVRAFRRDVSRVMGLPDVPVRDLAEDHKRWTHATDLERNGLIAFALVALLAGTVAVGQAIARVVYATGAQAPTLRALGFGRADLVVSMALPHVVTAGIAIVVATVISVGLSVLLPIGLAGYLDPSRGIRADVPVLALGAAVIAILILGGAVLASLLVLSRIKGQPGAAMPGRLAGVLSVKPPVPLSLGARLVFVGERGDRSVPSRPAIAGGIIGVLGILGSLGLLRGIDTALATPELSGQTWSATIYPDEEHSIEDIAETLSMEPRVGTIAYLMRVPLDLGEVGLPAYAVDPVRGTFSFTVVRGDAPVARDEAALGPATARALGLGIGDTLNFRGDVLRVTGLALLEETPHSSFDQGIWVHPTLLRPIAVEAPVGITVMAVATPGIGHAALADHLAASLPLEVEPTALPQDVLYLRNVRAIPLVLAAFLGALGVAALAHALTTTVRRRRHDLAILVALGFRPAQNRAVIAWQATLLAVVVTVIGIPLGIAAGRLTWAWVAGRTPLVFLPPVAAAAALLAAPVALIVANSLAAGPGRRAARVDAARSLRTE